MHGPMDIKLSIFISSTEILKKAIQSHYSPEMPRGFQEAKVNRLREIGTGWW